MKNFLKVSLVAVVLMFASCSSDDDNTNPLVGKWNYFSSSMSGSNANLSNCESKSYMVFTEETFTEVSYELYEGNCESETSVGSYITKDGKIILSDNDSSESINLEYSISGDELTVKAKEDGEALITVVYKRK
ncbi:lipocalin-like domain-containing protein [Tenacibaculum piscium]|uniref:lipocalin family protein n=1 Tax=Tenacibaculum piscium TaxID=1458515 RepID=UPI001F21B25A|nr:lipocalin family protein [Tenacibaculum piscium]